MNLFTYPKTQELLDFLKASGIKYAVLGGYARDAAHGVEARDLDIVIYGRDIDNSDMVALVYWLDERKELEQRIDLFEVDYQTEDNRIEYVVKTNYDVDVIFWSYTYETPQQVMDKFDYNINQYAMVSTPYGMEAKYMGSTPEGTLVQLRESSITPDRHCRVMEVAQDLGWEITFEKAGLSNDEIDELLD